MDGIHIRKKGGEMKKIAFVGRSGCGKTTLTQAIRGEELRYKKTQYVDRTQTVIDTPGEYAQSPYLGYILALYGYEADVIGFVMGADEDYSIYAPAVAAVCNREVIGIITKIHHERANVEQARRWLGLAGCRTIFCVDSVTGEGVPDIIDFLAADKEKTERENTKRKSRNTPKSKR